MKPRRHRADGHSLERQAQRLPFKVVTPEGRVLAANHTREGAERTALVLNESRAVPVRVVRRGERP